MSKSRRRAVLFTAGAIGVMLAYAFVYQYAMAAYEGVDVGYVESLAVVVESFTTTGYGEDAQRWSTIPMWLLVIAMQATGVGLIFTTLPLFVVPLVEETLATAPPTDVELEGHVVICEFTPRGETLIDELQSRDVPYVVVVEDRDRAEQLHEEGYVVVHGDPEELDSLGNAAIDNALALVADADDETNASIVLSAKEARDDVRVVSVVENGEVADYHRYAGADAVVSPRHTLGESLAGKVTTAVTAEMADAIVVAEDFEVAELIVQRDSELVGQTVAESEIGVKTGVNVIGAWFRGEFVSPPAPDAVIDEHTVLLVAGVERQLSALKELTLSESRRHRRGPVLVVGRGAVGATVSSALAKAEVPYTVVDKEEKAGVDVVGDITDHETLEAANVHEARSVVLALNSDTTTIFATLAVKQVAPDVEVIARANQMGSVSKLYRAGAEYVLALSTVSGRMLASNLLEEEVIAPDTQIDVVRTHAPGLTGQSLAEADVRARTNCTVVAVERNGELLTDLGAQFVVREGDELVVAGLDEDINRFSELLG
ncbi:metal transporter [Haloprofundus marisrubri]|uniref:Metal transporter n=1 Tax=Haloprofundus marisrubri TaxID=1514971 RepID=A0A0W1R9S1_9EURY|nr:NAD-binding protein [Haloprofundus marisrubri]KTG10110.1 metal transporter [Haloprofundus marisrubri]